MRRRSATFGAAFAEFHFGEGEIVIPECLTDLFASLGCLDTRTWSIEGVPRKWWEGGVIAQNTVPGMPVAAPKEIGVKRVTHHLDPSPVLTPGARRRHVVGRERIIGDRSPENLVWRRTSPEWHDINSSRSTHHSLRISQRPKLAGLFLLTYCRQKDSMFQHSRITSTHKSLNCP